MFLSIIVPVYNVEKYIYQCLDSIVSQIINNEEIEVIVVNDGTKDDSMAIVKQFVDKCPNVSILNQENQGLSQARNNGLDQAKGDYVWFVDSDDYLKPSSIDYLRSIIGDNPDVDVFASYMDRYIEGNNDYINKGNKGEVYWTGINYLTKGKPKGAAQRFIYKRDFLLKNGLRFTPGILHEDGVWGCEMLYCAQKVFLLPESVYVYRIRSNGSIMSNIKIKSAYDLIYGHKVLMNFLDKRVSKSDYFKFRQYIFSQIGCALGYSKPLYGSTEFETFYNENKQYIVGEARYLVKHGSIKVFPLVISISPRVMMVLMTIRNKLLSLIKKK